MKVAPEGTWIVTTSPSFQREGYGVREPSATLEGVQMAFSDLYCQPFSAEYCSWNGTFTMYYYKITKRGHPFPQLPIPFKPTQEEVQSLLFHFLEYRGIKGKQLTTKGEWRNFGFAIGVGHRKAVIDALEKWFEAVTVPTKKTPKVQGKKK